MAAGAVRARVYDTMAALLSRVGEPFLAWAAADRVMFAAEQSGDPAVVIGVGNGWWQALIPEPNGEIVTTRYTLRALLDSR